VRGILFSLCALALSVGAHAQPFPQPGRTVRIIVPFGPSGATDRSLHERWGEVVRELGIKIDQ
jgi:tripartite-type tricarboxylate transporter receptor subunit TctC